MLTDFLRNVGNIPRVNPHTHKVNLITQLTRHLNGSWYTDAKGIIGIHKKDTIFVGRSVSLESLIVIAINLYQGMGMGSQNRNVKELTRTHVAGSIGATNHRCACSPDGRIHFLSPTCPKLHQGFIFDNRTNTSCLRRHQGLVVDDVQKSRFDQLTLG
ncbi:Uncharacterised protein [Streptococcus pneumoniae]|nr:Uncharacterised protein [Streptococcus pneumoniae]